MSTEQSELTYLSRQDIENIRLQPTAVANAVRDILLSRARGNATNLPKLSLEPASGKLFETMLAIADDPPYAAIKTVGLATDNAQHGLPTIHALITLLDAQTGQPLAVMDGSRITALRTAAMTLVAARHMARKESHSIGFIGCGVQALGHLQALRAEFPIDSIKAYSRSADNRTRFAHDVGEPGLNATAVDTPREAVEHSDIVITSVPATPGLEPFLELDWLAPGAFVSMVDRGRSWQLEALSDLGRVTIDDLDQERQLKKPFIDPELADSDLTELLTGSKTGRGSPEERTVFMFRGMAIADLAVAALAYGSGIAGKTLPL